MVLIRVQLNGLLWKTCELEKVNWMVKHMNFPDFSGILVFWNFLNDSIQYSLVQSQQWRYHNNVPDIFTVKPSRPNPERREKNKLNLYFHTSLWCLRRFYEGLKGLDKSFWDTTKNCENKKFNLIFISRQLSEMYGPLSLNIKGTRMTSLTSLGRLFCC